ncbi:hypothetical protein G6F57_009751 [Rhizopus arrhizus]|nr:hypothetical protein G6F30_010030 [Rhizopus arrhizus]KAG1407804.1 hypothetical protein G6F58_009596 [Rhizopus delemar]KAG0977219.1 hypothetical protein G6F29_010235 [Rhizopus arrhizus]KAG0987136.1 hypothetical protein G6F28_010085 [Rhizopus arrhizus]KAG1004004.1 hypothetical protein G6F27_010537 [Rhizopus arrhizus]
MPPSSSGRTTSSTVSSIIYDPPIPSKHSSSPNSVPPPPSKVAKPKRDNFQPSLTAITKQFSSPIEPTGSKLIHVPVRRPLPMQQIRSKLHRLHFSTR